MRAFVLMRQMVAGYEELLKRIEELEASTDAQFNDIYQALTQLLSQSSNAAESDSLPMTNRKQTGNGFGNGILFNMLYFNK